MGFNKEKVESALKDVNYCSIEEALDILATSNDKRTMQSSNQKIDIRHEGPSSSKHVAQVETDVRLVPDVACNTAFCRDGVSSTLEMLFDKANVQTANDALCVIVHALMLESGFCLKGLCESDPPEILPSGWNDGDIVKLHYVHHLTSSIVCQLIFSKLGPFIYAYVCSKELKSSTYQVKLKVSHYIRSDVPIKNGARSTTRNLHKLSTTVKNNLIHPFHANLLSHLGVISPYSLHGLPPEIQLMILSLLPVRGVLSLSATCKALHVVCNDEKLWQYFCQRDFAAESNDRSWKEYYKKRYKQRQQYRLDTRTPIYQPIIQSVPPPLNPFLPRVPQILGGPHDLFPDFLTGQPRTQPDLRILRPDDRSRSDLRLSTADRVMQGTFFA
ncbi:F-box only protein 7-like [Xenia sp. Carnegie-2017]|uniref:F-box only protein 7-like n=1 Tax=Xenia sp. Carnegie-2017 TaxID=2897299 RepID=UPI001F048BDB|nr:F-box only protein 7-like [Xenia sp. Carnegie-2017]